MRWLESEGERRTSWVAMVTGRPVGMASLFEYRRMPRPRRLASRWGYISNMFVHKECADLKVSADQTITVRVDGVLQAR
ncbi:MAG: GNAT family N-acetyltransferase [Solirubrobacteraceae bacterium]